MRILPLLLLTLIVVAPAAADTSPRNATARPFNWDEFGEGSWIKYRMSYNMKGVKIAQEYEITLTLNEVTDEQVTISYQYKMNGQVFPPTRQTRSREEVANPMIQKGAKKIKSGRENFVYKKRKIICTVTDYELESRGMTLKYRVWSHHTVPSGVLKMTMKAEGPTQYDMSLETVEYERKK